MAPLSNYKLREKLHESRQFVIYRGVRQTDGQTVVLKFPKTDLPAAETLAQLQHAYKLNRAVESENVIKVYELTRQGPSLALAMEDGQGQSLDRFLSGRSLDLDDFLRIAGSIAQGLEAIHQSRIVHNTIRPSHIIIRSWPVNATDKHFGPNGQVKIICFDHAAPLVNQGRAPATVRQPQVSAYTSPEQTGRLNRTVDYRTDFYSLGVTYYEMLVGHPPFELEDKMELIHAHLAKTPPAPHQLRPEIPPIVSKIVMKLLAKSAEDRYQSAMGLYLDLQRCLSQLKNSGTITDFPLGRSDTADKFKIPHKLYGRDNELNFLLTTFEQLLHQRRGLLVVSGYAGVGKSRLVQELQMPLLLQQGRMIAGKFDQYQYVPYSAIIQAFQELVHQLLTESPNQLQVWRHRLLEALGSNAQLIIDIIPPVERITGPQPAVPNLSPAEGQNRFHLIFQRFVRVFATRQHPLVLFIDDLQWADSASLNLIETLLSDPQTNDLLLVGAYRDNEVGPGHALARTLAAIEQAEVPLHRLVLPPLDREATATFISDAFADGSDRITALTYVVMAKTGGNPFFIIQFLKSLHARDRVVFDRTTGRWQWDLAKLRTEQITENVVDLIADRVQQLSATTQQVLQLAACLGSQFNLETLALISQQPVSVIEGALAEAVEAELLLRTPETYKFTHDRIEQAVYSQITEADRPVRHWQIGQRLLTDLPPEQLGERIFEVVNQLNRGQSVIERPSIWWLKLAQLNLRAGQRALTTAAHASAFDYLQHGLNLLRLGRSNSWRSDYALTLQLHLAAAEVAYVIGRFAEMERLTGLAVQHAQSAADRLAAFQIRVQALIAQNELLEAIQYARPILKRQGINLTARPNQIDAALALAKTKLLLRRYRPADLIHLPEMTDPHHRAVVQFLNNCILAAYFAVPELLPSIIYYQLRLTVKYGASNISASNFSVYGLLLCGAAGDIEGGGQFGRLAQQLLWRFNDRKMVARTLLAVGGFIQHWQEPISVCLATLKQAYDAGRETGELDFAAYAALTGCYYSYLIGRPLNAINEEMRVVRQSLSPAKQKTLQILFDLWRQAILNLLGQTAEPGELKGEAYNETEMFTVHHAAQDKSALFDAYFNKLLLNYLFRNYRQALSIATLVGKNYLDGAIGLMTIPLFYFYDSLTRLALCEAPERSSLDQSERQRLLDQVARNRRKLKKWAQHAPMNYRHRLTLVDAERARVLGRPGVARELYDQAIAQAQTQGFTNDEAVAQELAGRYYLERGQRHWGEQYIRQAIKAYQRWEATAKVKALAAEFPQLSEQPAEDAVAQETATLDLGSVIKASQAISGQIILSDLLEKLMRIVIENAGAQRGFLILSKNDQLVIEAAGATDEAQVTTLQSLPIDSPGAPPLARGVVNYVARLREPVVLGDAARGGEFTHDHYILTYRPKSILCAPLVNQGQLTGLIYLENNLTTDAFTASQVKLLTLLSAQIAISIQNASLYADLKRSEKKYRTIFEESRDVIVLTTPNGQVIDINPAGLRLFGYTEEEARQANVVQNYLNPSQRLLFRQMMEERGSVKDFEVKLKKKDGTVLDGLVSATVRVGEDGKTVGYQTLLRDITAQKQVEQERLQFSAIQRELSLAQEIQQGLLPPAIPNWPNLDMVCYSVPTRNVGGDLYAYHAFGDGKFAVAVGDVSGKGMPAALLMAVSLSALQSIIRQQFAPGQLLAHLDETISTYTTHTHQNCALIYADLTFESESPRQATLRVANAGCMTPVIKYADGSVAWIEVAGLPLGSGFSIELGYIQKTVQLNQGDLIILTSDGVVEANNRQNELFGFGGLEEAVCSGPQSSAQAMLDHLKTRVEAHADGADLADDVTIVVIKI